MRLREQADDSPGIFCPENPGWSHIWMWVKPKLPSAKSLEMYSGYIFSGNSEVFVLKPIPFGEMSEK